MNENLLQKINSELEGLRRNTATLEKIIRTQGTSTELDYEISKNDLEIFVWQKIKEIANGKETSLDLQNLSPYFFFPSEIKNLENLSHLNLKENSLSILPSEVLTLTNLNSLNLANNHIQSLPDEFKNLGNLERLNLSFENPISRPNPTHEHGQLSHELRVRRTVIRGNLDLMQRFPDDIESITECADSIKNERILYKQHHMPNNLFEKLPSQITKLSKLTYLDISNVMLMDLTPEIGNLQNLEHLDVNYNFLQFLPPEIRQLKKLRFLDLRGNNLPIPSEILDKVDQPQTILNYYFSLSVYREIDGNYLYAYDNASPLNQVKLIVIGQGSNGKTSLVRRIISDTFDQKQSKTDGIEINKWYIHRKRNTIPLFIVWDDKSPDNPNSKIQINTWDFGGQEIMHATHQFFLTKRSLYLLVLDARLTQEENRVEYWLKIIQSFGGESPVLIVGNKIDQHPLDIDRTGLQKKYPNIVGILETSAATGAGIEELKAAITEQVNNLPHVRDLLPETWFTVKTKLEELGKQSNFITQEKYLDLCAENKVNDETSQRTLIGFLHDLGVVLHFQDDPRLEALGILNPQWVTNGVYKILNSHTLFQNKGVLTTSILDEILNLPEYPRGKRLFIVDMMKKFELCYDIESDKTFLVSDLLPKDEPAELKFNGVPAFEYAYPVLPSSVITRFIVRMNQKIENHFVWRTGVVLKIGENKALVKADIEDRKITIAIDGVEHTRRDALSAIRYQLDEIHASIKGLNPQKRIPVPNAANAEPLEYDYLLMLEREGQEFHLAKDGTRLVKVNVREVLSAVESEAQRKETGGTVTNIYIGGNVEGSNIISGNNNVVTQNIQNSFNKAHSADIQAELKETLKQLATAVDAMSKVMPAEQATEAADDLGKLVEEATKPKPNKKWYSVSVDGLVKAAENIGKVGEPVIDLSRKVLSLLTGGVVK